MIQAHHHAHTTLQLPLNNALYPFPYLCGFNGRDATKGGFRIGREVGTCKAPKVVNAAHGADKVAVGHVGEGGEVGVDAPRRGNLAARSQPLASFFDVGMRGVF